MSVTIGIDFGTTNCSASLVNPNTGKPEAVRFKDTETWKIPSIIEFLDNGNVFVGKLPFRHIEDIATDQSLTEEERIIQEGSFYDKAKSRMSPTGYWMRPDKNYTHAELISIILQKIKEEVAISYSINEKDLDKLVLTRPVEFPGWKKDILKHAAALAGFKKVKLLEEPKAAAIYALKAKRVPSTCKGLLVYDFGGGTIDVTYVQIESDGELHTPVSSQGDAQCGGDNIDHAIYQDWDTYLKSTKGRGVSPDPTELDVAFMYRCRRLKEECSRNYFREEIREYIPGIGRVNRPFSKKDFDRIVEPIIDKTIAKVNQVLHDVKQKKLPLTHAILIGGSSNLPMVKDKLKAILDGVEIITTNNDDIAVAVGAMYSVTTQIHEPQPNETFKAKWEYPKPQPPKECYCIHCGKKIMTSHKVCMFCGKPNFSYKP